MRPKVRTGERVKLKSCFVLLCVLADISLKSAFFVCDVLSIGTYNKKTWHKTQPVYLK